jgi:protease I
VNIKDACVAVLAENLYQELELWYPVLRLREAGATVRIVGSQAGEVYASKIGYPVVAEVGIDEVTADDFDAVVVPGGFSPEYLRRNPAFVDFVRALDDRGAPVAAICHAGWLLATADIVRGRAVTSVAVIKDDVVHAGGDWKNEPVVVDGNLITSQLPNDLPDFLHRIITALVELPEGARSVSPTVRAAVPSSAVYKAAAVLKNRPAGPVSANYRAYAVPGA